MSNISALYTIDQLINDLLLSQPESQRTDSEYKRYFNFAISGLRELRLLYTEDGKNIIKVEPDNVNRINFPSDMEEFIALGVPVQGKIWWLTRKNDMIPTKTVVGLDESLDSDDDEGELLQNAQSNTFSSVGGINLQGYYTIDNKNREIIINNTQRTELLLAYTSSGVELSSTTYFPTKYVEALKSWISWKDIEFDKSVNEAIKDSYEKRYNRKIKDIQRIEAPSHIEILDAWRNKNILM
jgi:hypothetical protein